MPTHCNTEGFPTVALTLANPQKAFLAPGPQLIGPKLAQQIKLFPDRFGQGL